jgi:CDP-diacylglycerol--serine O-phosphatidyltransferase
VDERQTKEFIGLPTPANTLWIIALPLMLLNRPGEWEFLLRSAPLLLMLCAVSSWLLVAEIPLFSFKLSGWSWQANLYPYLLLVLSAPLLLYFSFAALPPIIGFYVLLSIIRNQRTSKR